MGNGLAALMGLLGGGGKGLYEGTSAGIEDQQKAALLAERQRQFDEGQFSDISPEQSAATGLPAGRMQKALIPAFLQNLQKKELMAEHLRRGEQAAQAYEKMAAAYPEGGREPGSAVDLSQNPEAAGIPVTPAQPNRYLTGAAGLARSGAPKEDITPLTEFYKQLGLQSRLSQSGATSQLFQTPDGEVIEIPKHRGLDKITPTGVMGIRSRGTGSVTAHDQARSMGLIPGSPEYTEYMQRAANRPVTTPPGGYTRDLTRFLSAGGQQTAPQAGQQEPQEADWVTFHKAMFDAGVPEEEIIRKWESIQPGMPPASVTVPRKPGAPVPQPARGPQPSVRPDVRELPGQTYVPPTVTDETIKTAANDIHYLEEVLNLADRLEKWQQGRTTGENIGMAARTSGYRHDPTGILKAAIPLDPEAADIQAQAGRLRTAWEATSGGMRAVSGPQIQPMLAEIHGGEALSNPNSFINLRSLADEAYGRLRKKEIMEEKSGRTIIHRVPDEVIRKMDELYARRNKPKESSGSGFDDWRRGLGR